MTEETPENDGKTPDETLNITIDASQIVARLEGFSEGLKTASAMQGAAQYTPYSSEMRGDAIDRLKALAIEGSKPDIISIPTAGLGRGLPPVVPVGWDRRSQEFISLIDLIEEARPEPEREGTATVNTLAPFIALVERHKDDGSVIFAETAWPNPKLTAVMDYHTLDNEARFGKHRVVYAFPLTEEFKVWIAGDSKPMEQAKFALFLEEHVAELASPFPGEVTEFEEKFKARFGAPNELLSLSRSLEVNEGSKVKQAFNPQTGERQVVFTTEHTNAAGEPIDIPGIFMVSVPPFISGDAEPPRIRIPARIRYRISGGAISWFYQLYRWEYFLREQVQADLQDAATTTGLPAYEGKPEMAA